MIEKMRNRWFCDANNRQFQLISKYIITNTVALQHQMLNFTQNTKRLFWLQDTTVYTYNSFHRDRVQELLQSIRYTHSVRIAWRKYRKRHSYHYSRSRSLPVHTHQAHPYPTNGLSSSGPTPSAASLTGNLTLTS